MEIETYRHVWIAFVEIEAMSNYKFNDLIDVEDGKSDVFNGAWANILLKGDSIGQVLPVISLGLRELKFQLVYIDKIENVQSLFEENNLSESVLKECDWLIESDYIFKISDKLFPYV